MEVAQRSRCRVGCDKQEGGGIRGERGANGRVAWDGHEHERERLTTMRGSAAGEWESESKRVGRDAMDQWVRYF